MGFLSGERKPLTDLAVGGMPHHYATIIRPATELFTAKEQSHTFSDRTLALSVAQNVRLTLCYFWIVRRARMGR